MPIVWAMPQLPQVTGSTRLSDIEELSSEELCERLIEEHTALAIRIGRSHARKLGADEDECISASLLALVMESRKWDPRKGHQKHDFPAHMHYIIPLRIIDRLRENPGWARNAKLAKFTTTSLDRLRDSVEDGSAPWEPPDPETVETTLDLTMEAELLDRLPVLLKALPERERVALLWDGTLAELGRHWGVTESRVCQVYRKGLDRLRALIRADDFKNPDIWPDLPDASPDRGTSHGTRRGRNPAKGRKGRPAPNRRLPTPPSPA